MTIYQRIAPPSAVVNTEWLLCLVEALREMPVVQNSVTFSEVLLLPTGAYSLPFTADFPVSIAYICSCY